MRRPGARGGLAHHRALHAAYRQAWDELRQAADTDHDGSVSREEYLAAMERGMSADPEYLERAVLCVSRALFEAADAEGDGVLHRDEYVKTFVAIDMDGEVAAAGFDHIDRDGDDEITYEEFLEALHGVFSSSDPAGRGAMVLG